MRKLIVILVLCAAASGCSHLTAPPPATTGITAGDLASYFWPDADTTYTYQSSTGETHKLHIMMNGMIADNQVNHGQSTTLIVTSTNGSYSLSGFSADDIFELDTSIQVVRDTLPGGPGTLTETIRSIATASLGALGSPANLYAVSDSVLYQVDASLTIHKIISIPAGLTLAEDDAQNQLLFAYTPLRDSIMWTSDGMHWTTITTPGNAPITAFTSAAPNFILDICWFACGQDIYRVSVSGTKILITQVISLPSGVSTMAAEDGGVIVGFGDGSIYSVLDNGQMTKVQTVPDKLSGIAYIDYGYDPILAATPSGIYSIPIAAGNVTNIVSGTASSIYSTGTSIFAGLNNAVYHFYLSGGIYDTYTNPPAGPVTQFAHPISPIDDSTQGIYVLAGTSVFRRDSANVPNGGKWTAVNQNIPTQGHPTQGALTLLADSASWLAGYIVNNVSGQPHGYAYQASGSGPYAQVVLDSVSHNNVYIVLYTAYSNGVADITHVPQYTIYYQRGMGPIQIVKTENNLTTTTTIAK